MSVVTDAFSAGLIASARVRFAGCHLGGCAQGQERCRDGARKRASSHGNPFSAPLGISCLYLQKRGSSALKHARNLPVENVGIRPYRWAGHSTL
jgi:hypothetical protein